MNPFGDQPVGYTVQPCPPPDQKIDRVHWIEIKLIGEDNLPIPEEEYKIELPNGEVARGYLDGNGKARVDNMKDGGMCRISFPRLDQDAWEEAPAQPVIKPPDQTVPPPASSGEHTSAG